MSEYWAEKALVKFESQFDQNNTYNIKNNRRLSEKSKVWKYMDFAKFVSMLYQKSLFFPKPSLFVDNHEGSYSALDVNNILNDPLSYLTIPVDERLSKEEKRRQLHEYIKQMHDYVGVNCWHLNEEESAAMWNLYLKSDEGIAICSTVEKLYSSISDKRFHTYIGQVQYINFNSEMASLNPYETLFYKRRSFSHENEIRLLAFDNPNNRIFDHKDGAYVQSNLNTLIDEVYVSPTSPEWLREVVQSVLEKYRLPFKPVIKSSLYEGPFY
ncbi:DUF2971 domain-containing protein [Fictibacillus sp. WQ 8-8]|uniref:DUF2971 domain-containing protein n=1 Tax=unclassified Fictibacillus TaxID=2644029 RepID=UPI0007830609|nr:MULTISPECIES: DUF2971 domain-containing protein [unclassified Fictibacillus]MCQ6267085.1 DUF2971 domain-containing protein [Fictibacillus sp. WQ 8-8]MED2972140.1 DUF2971 domain-containing protein [Fictibacillus sp. B-59209]SFE24048.1 Protein of unknown function [Bacillus sp. OV194]